MKLNWNLFTLLSNEKFLDWEKCICWNELQNSLHKLWVIISREICLCKHIRLNRYVNDSGFANMSAKTWCSWEEKVQLQVAFFLDVPIINLGNKCHNCLYLWFVVRLLIDPSRIVIIIIMIHVTSSQWFSQVITTIKHIIY